MSEIRTGKFAGDNPFEIAQRWLTEAEAVEPNDPNAMSLATVDAQGMPNVRVVLLKALEAESIVFYTNYESQKARELESSGMAAIGIHWKSLRRQIKMRGVVSRVEGAMADEYYASRSVQSRIGAWASKQSRPLDSRAALESAVAEATNRFGDTPPRPPFWGGYRIVPLEIEFWADGPFRLHDRFQWLRSSASDDWRISRLNP